MHRSEYSAASPVQHVLLIAPLPPPYGGMALQALLLQRMLRGDGVSADVLGYNYPLPARFSVLQRIPGVRTAMNAGIYWIRLWKHIPRNDVVHILAASWLYFFLIVCPAIAMGRLRGKRVIVNYRGGDADLFFKKWGWLSKPFLQMAHLVTAPSEFLSKVIKKRLGFPVSIVPNIVEVSRFKFRTRSRFEPKIIVTRHLEELYGVEFVVRAFGRIQEGHPAASLWIGGTGSQERFLRDLVVDLGLRNVRFLGAVDHATLPSIYDQCDILMNASRVDNFPGSLVEASAAGLVVISTKAGGIPFIYENGKDAILVDVGDWEGLASGVKRVIEHQDLARELVAAGVKLCAKCHWANVRGALYSAYCFTRPQGLGPLHGPDSDSPNEPNYYRNGRDGVAEVAPS